MAHDHSWYRPEALDERSFEALVNDVHSLLHSLPAAHPEIALRGQDGSGHPSVSIEGIYFNGDASLGQDHVPFYLPRTFEVPSPGYPRNEMGWPYTYCSTGHKPYNFVVLAVLIILTYHFPQITVASDASPSDWIKATQWYADTFGNRSPGPGPWQLLEEGGGEGAS